MSLYLVNKEKTDGFYNEVHIDNGTCNNLPDPKNRVSLGDHSSCQTAVLKADSDGYFPADGCKHCSPECHND